MDKYSKNINGDGYYWAVFAESVFHANNCIPEIIEVIDNCIYQIGSDNAVLVESLTGFFAFKKIMQDKI